MWTWNLHATQLEFTRSFLEACVAETFAEMLRTARRNSRDPQRGGTLSQERFAELVSRLSKRPSFPTPGTVSNWECGRSRPSGQDRETLLAIVGVLLEYGGLVSASDASALLVCGGYAPLRNEETRQLGELHTKLIAVGECTESEVATTAIRWTADARSEKRDAWQAETRFTGSIAPSDDMISSAAKPVETPTLIAIRHQSIEQIPEQALLASLPDEYRHYCVIELVVDQCDLFQASRLTDPLEAARRQVNLEGL